MSGRTDEGSGSFPLGFIEGIRPSGRASNLYETPAKSLVQRPNRGNQRHCHGKLPSKPEGSRLALVVCTRCDAAGFLEEGVKGWSTMPWPTRATASDIVAGAALSKVSPLPMSLLSLRRTVGSWG